MSKLPGSTAHRSRNSPNRALILQHALHLFTEHGYDAVGVQGICEAAGVTKPTLYHYFGNKRGVLEAIISDTTLHVLSELEGSLSYCGDLRHNLESVAAGLLHTATVHKQAFHLLLTVQHAPRLSESRRAAGAFFAELRRRLRELFQAAVEDHGNMRGREDAYAVSFQATVFGYIELLLEEQKQPDNRLPQQIMHQFAHGIFS